jgi:hypothetical protein
MTVREECYRGKKTNFMSKLEGKQNKEFLGILKFIIEMIGIF